MASRNAFHSTIALSLAIGLAWSAPLAAQKPDSARTDSLPTHVLRQPDRSVVFRRILSQTGDSVRFQLEGGIIVVPTSSVVELRTVERRAHHDVELVTGDPNDSRLFFAPTGRMLRKGDGYFSDTYLLFLNFVGGVSSNV